MERHHQPYYPFGSSCPPLAMPLLNEQPQVKQASLPSQKAERKNFQVLNRQLQRKCELLVCQKQMLEQKLSAALYLLGKKQSTPEVKRTVIRRTEDELNKGFKCCYYPCKKEYASVLALNLHVKRKHNGGTKNQRDQLAKRILIARSKGQEEPKANIKLPRDYLESYKEDFQVPSSTDKQVKMEE